MTTIINFYVAPPGDSLHHRERYPFGPGADGFKTAQTIEADPGTDSYRMAIAVAPGMLRLIPDAPSATTTTGVLIPWPFVTRDLASIFGGGVPVFVYRNLDVASTETVFQPRIDAMTNEMPFLKDESSQSRVDRFAKGEFPVHVSLGDTIGLASLSGGTGGWALLGFEIAFISSGLVREEGWSRLKRLVDPTTTRTRRFDPAAFFAAVAAGTSSVSLATSHAGHALFNIVTKRTLLELRDERGEPFIGNAEVYSQGDTMPMKDFTAASRGIVELATAAPGTTASHVGYALSAENHLFTELPSGSSAEIEQDAGLTAPAHWALTTIFMADVNDPSNWFVANTAPLPRFTANNRITPLIDGVTAFTAMVRGMRLAAVSAGYIRLAGWWLTDSFNLIPADATSTVAALTTSAATAGATVRALLWDTTPPAAPSSQNDAEVNHINALPSGNGRAILDNHTLATGSHHQKLLIVSGSGRALGFCGGVDINPDRLDDTNHCGMPPFNSPFHDVHAQVDGPAIADLNTTFVQRWNSHPDNPPALSTAAPPFDPSPGTQFVQVTRTYPPSMHYPFVGPTDDLGTLHAVRNAIRSARRFIYVEDQYLTPYPGDYPFQAAQDSVGVLTDLLAALGQSSFEYLIAVIPNHADQQQNRFRRQRFISSLRDAFPDKVHIFYLARTCTSNNATPTGASKISGGPDYPDEVYVHAKSWIVDDVYVKIGSSNCNRRSYTNDSELDIHIVDGAVDDGARGLAKHYRMDLWAEHLNMAAPARRALLDDPSYALSFWLNPPTGARIRPYAEETDADSGFDLLWNNVIDPDGR